MSASDETQTDDRSTTATDDAGTSEKPEYRLSLDVHIDNSGPCRKHVRVRIPRTDLSHFHGEALGEFSEQADVPGFRKGHAPAKLIEKRFRKELDGEVKQRILMRSLQQVADDHKLDPIDEPDLDVETLKIPEEGDFEFEFDVEVRPEFDLPDYKGLQIRRPVREVTDKDVDAYLEQFLSQHGQLVPHEEAAAAGDFVVLEATFTHNGEKLKSADELIVQIKPKLRFHDAELAGFDKLMKGVKAGDTRDARLIVSQEAESIEMRGETVEAQFAVQDVKRLRLPELDKEFLNRLGVETESELREEVRRILERQVTFEQRQSARAQVLEKITESAKWELPEKLVLKQVENALRRQILEMQQAGYTRQQILAKENELRQQAVTSTRQALKEHFVLDKIATNEKIEVDPDDIDTEVRLMALQQGESPRRLYARMIKSGMIENLEAQIRERKAIDHILEGAKFKDLPAEKPAKNDIEAADFSICGLSRETTDASADEEEAAAEDE